MYKKPIDLHAILISSATLFLAASTIAVQAQEPGNNDESTVLEEIVVTASKRGATSAQDLSLSITAFDANKLERLNAVDFDEFIVQVPGTNFINDGGPGRGNEVASIRGLSTVADNTVGVVAQYLDGAPHFGNSYRLFDISEVSVLRGPQGTLWGSQAIGGLISYRSNRPDPSAFEAMAQADLYSSKNDDGLSYRASGMLNLPLVTDTFALRFAGHHIDETGYIENIRTGTSGINNVEESAWRISGLLHVNDRVSITAIYHGNDLEADAPTYIDLALDGRQVDQPSDFGRAFQKYDLFNFIVDVDLDWATLNYTGSRYSNDGSWRDYNDSAGFLERIDTVVDEKATTHELRLASSGSGRLQWLVGVYSDDYDDFNQSTSFVAAEVGDPNAVESLRQGGLRTFEETAVFGEMTIALSDRWSVLLGGRWFDWELDNQEVFLIGGSDFGFVTNGVAGDDDFFYKLQVDYAVNDDVLVYATRSEGFRFGGFNTFVGEELFGISEQFFEFGPDTLVNYELGAKSRLADNRVTLNGAVYYLDWQEMQAVVQSNMAGAFGQGFFTTNAPDLEAYGLELELVTQDFFAPGLYAAASFAWTDNEFQDDAQLFPGTRVTIREGDSLRRTPKYTWSLDLGYEFQLSNGLDAFVRANYWHKDSTSTFGFDGNDGNVDVPAQDVVNFSTGVRWDEFEVKLYVDNLTDEIPLLNVFSGNAAGLPGADEAVRANSIRSRTYGVQMTAWFGGL
ncbi:TonB-dependent receptor [Elongatibacter sediminis]|uniref:TonB-dependent receptor n=1 Tax=Elongatibacter sediminis TaxID=3119006 RepID=A0AAW9R7W5_9GAMM